MTEEIYGVVIFFTSSAALRSERLLLKEGLNIKLIPTPREFSSDCGMALRFVWSEEPRVSRLLSSANVEVSSIRKLN